MAEQRKRIVHGALRAETAPQTTESVVNQSLLSSLGVMLLDFVGNFAKELVLLLAPLTLWSVIYHYYDWQVATVVTAVVVFALLIWPHSRRFIAGQVRSSHIQRRWNTAARFAGLTTHNDHVPTPHRITQTPVGDRLKVRIPSGCSFTRLESAKELLATCLEVRDVRVQRDRDNARYAIVDIVRRDPLGESEPLVWPNISAERLSLWESIPVGVNEFGEVGSVVLPERNVLIGGEPGAGKSVALSQLVATAALDVSCDLTLLDGKRVELAPWAPSAEAVVGPSISDACDVLRGIQSEMDVRYEQLLTAGLRKVERHGGHRLHVVVCDELAFYLTMGDRKENQEFERLMRDIVARGRAAGVIVLGATQRPSHDIVPTSLRDLFAFRWALRCTTPQASDTILGQGWASQGFSAQDIDAAHKGVGYLRHEGAEPVRLRSFCLNDSDIDALAKRAFELRNPPQALSPVA